VKVKRKRPRIGHGRLISLIAVPPVCISLIAVAVVLVAEGNLWIWLMALGLLLLALSTVFFLAVAIGIRRKDRRGSYRSLRARDEAEFLLAPRRPTPPPAASDQVNTMQDSTAQEPVSTVQERNEVHRD
jgi:hypothetical protein